jgi:hypothetical protein
VIQTHTNGSSATTSVNAKCETLPHSQLGKPHLYLSEEKSYVQNMNTIQQFSARPFNINNTKIPKNYFKNVVKFKHNSNQSQ